MNKETGLEDANGLKVSDEIKYDDLKDKVIEALMKS